MATYKVSVRVDLEYEVECENESEATDQGWNWEDYIMHSEVYSIDVEELQEDED